MTGTVPKQKGGGGKGGGRNTGGREGVDSWLGPAFLESLLRRALREPQLEVTRGHVRPDDDDDSYEDGGGINALRTQVVRRVSLEWAAPGRAGEAALLVKAEACGREGGGGDEGAALRRMRFLAKERAMYASALPDMERLQARMLPPGKNPPPPLAPDFYPCDRRDAVVIEDLRAAGFRAADAQRGLNLEHCACALRALAHLHASSVALRKHRPDVLLDFWETFYTHDNDSLSPAVEPALSALADHVAHWPRFEHLADRIRGLRDTAVDRLVEAMKPDGARPLVLNHGDFWTGSLLFQYHSPSGAVAEVRMFNFQLARWGSPALDLQFFMHTSPSEGQVVRAQCSDRLLELYHVALCGELAGLHCFAEVPTMEQLRGEMQRKAVVGVVAALCVLADVLGGPDDPRCRSALQRLLAHFEAQGLL